jgi:DNA-binding transcriptional LysR family regulator
VHSIRHLELIRALAEHRHFGRAATALGVSQPALTRSLKYLEDDLGVPLFDRDGVTPTLFGRIILRHGERVLDEFAGMMREITLAKGLEIGELAIVAGPYAAEISGQQAIGRLSALYPGLAVRLDIVDWTRAVEDVAAGRADLALAEIAEASQQAELEVEPLSMLPLRFYCARTHPLAGRSSPSLDDLLGFPWVGPTTPARISAALPRTSGNFGTFDFVHDRFLPRITVETFAAARNIVASGLGVGAAAPYQIRREVEQGELVVLPIDVPWLRLNYGFITRRGRSRSPAATAYMAIVREIEREIAARDPA